MKKRLKYISERLLIVLFMLIMSPYLFVIGGLRTIYRFKIYVDYVSQDKIPPNQYYW